MLLNLSLILCLIYGAFIVQNSDVSDNAAMMRVGNAVSTTRISCIGHRGAPGSILNPPENTLLSFKVALESERADGIELDLHRSLDNELLILHDDTLDRTTNGTGYVWDRGYFDYIIYLKTKNKQQKVPIMLDILYYLMQLDRNSGKLPDLIVDIKPTNPVQIVDQFVLLIRQFEINENHKFKNRIFLGVWEPRFIDRAKQLKWKGRLMLITKSLTLLIRLYRAVDSINISKYLLMLLYNNQYPLLKKHFAKSSKHWSVWTVDNAIEMRLAAKRLR